MIYHMMVGLYDSETIESGEEDLERWAGEFFRQLARVSNKTRQLDARGSGVHVLAPPIANDLKNDKRPLAVVQMQDFLKRIRAGEKTPMVPGWIEGHQVAKEMLKGD